MGKRIYIIIFKLSIIIGSVNAQDFKIEIHTGEIPQIVISIKEGTSITALQFTLKLPEDITPMLSCDNFGITLGSATNGHTLYVEMLDKGDFFFILYSIDLNTFKNGELLRIPITMKNETFDNTANLYAIHVTRTDAVSYSVPDTDDFATYTKYPQIVNGELNDKLGYDLSGRQTNAFKQKGIYIMNRRKIISNIK